MSSLFCLRCSHQGIEQNPHWLDRALPTLQEQQQVTLLHVSQLVDTDFQIELQFGEVDEEAACTVSSSNKSSKGEAFGRTPKKSSQSFAAHRAKQSQTQPFNSAELVLNSQIYYMLRYHFSYSIVKLTRSDILAREQTPERHHYSRYLQEIVRNCLSSEIHMYPLLSVTAGRMTIASKAHERHASHFMHNATRLLREYFLTPNPAIDS